MHALDLTGVDLATEVVRTERLVLRPYRPDDVDDVLRAYQDPEIQRWITALPGALHPRGRRRVVGT